MCRCCARVPASGGQQGWSGTADGPRSWAGRSWRRRGGGASRMSPTRRSGAGWGCTAPRSAGCWGRRAQAPLRPGPPAVTARGVRGSRGGESQAWLAAMADGCDPLALQASLARAMLAADAPALPVYFVDDHFVPYCGAKPVMKGWNTKRRHARKGRADTLVTDYHGRAVCFVTGEPSGLTATLPPAL